MLCLRKYFSDYIALKNFNETIKNISLMKFLLPDSNDIIRKLAAITNANGIIVSTILVNHQRLLDI